MKLRATGLVGLLLATTACESITHDKEVAQLRSQVSTLQTELTDLKSEQRQLKGALVESSVSRPFEEAMIGFATEIVPTLTRLAPSNAPPRVTVRAITLSGRTRVAHSKASEWFYVASCPVSDAFDTFGPYVERALRMRLAENGRAVVSESAPFSLSGAYEPDTTQTIRIHIGLSRRNSPDIISSFIKRIDRSSINPVELHFLDQIQ